MATGYNCPQTFARAVDGNGNPAPGAKLYHYLTGTTIPKKIYFDVSLTQPCPQPLVADADGNFQQFFLEDGGYKFALFDQLDNQLRPPEEPIFGTGGTGNGNGDTYKVKVDEEDLVPGFLVEKLEDTDDIEWAVSSGGPDEDHTIRATLAKPYPVTELSAFPAKDINWVQDTAGDLWDGETTLAFRIDFLTNGHRELVWFKSIFYANAGTTVGKFAIYGELDTKLYEGSLSDGSLYGVSEFDEPIDISDYEFLVVVMDPGVSAAPQPAAQSIATMPISSGLGRYAFAHMVEHVHNAAFPDEAPSLPAVEMKYMLARWCALGVR